MVKRTVASALWLIAFSTTAAVCQEDLPDERPMSDQLVESALRFELDGDNKYREMTLQAALHADPEHALAHWLLGQIRVNDRWIKFRDLDRSLTTGSIHERYRLLRDEALGDPAAEIALARWCRREGIRDLSDVHFRRTLEIPETTAAQRELAAEALNLRRVGDRWLTAEDVETQRRATSASQKAFREWERQIFGWRRHIEGGVSKRREKALGELRAVSSVDAIGALESSLSPLSSEYALEVVEILSRISGRSSTDSLVRHALGAPWEDVAVAAADALKPRPKENYVPALLGALQKPLVTMFQIRSGRNGVVHEHIVMEENEDRNILVRGNFLDRRNNGDLASLGQAQLRARRINEDIRETNQQRNSTNSRTFATLERTTGEVLRQDASAWWQWWDDYNDIYTSEEPKPTEVRDERYVFAQPSVPALPTASCECFQSGTMVWTESGKRPIEEIQPGDRVVAQDPSTGEVSLKPVIRRTVRPPGYMMSITIDGTTIVATRGHPFWVNHYGWKMARQLEPGQEVHSLQGALVVDATERIGERLAAYNLVVEDFGTYFVTDKAILVHDNTGRANSEAIVPGLIEPGLIERGPSGPSAD
jgi:hypothetical protein